MSISLFPGEFSVQAEWRESWDRPWQPCMWVGIKEIDGESQALIILADGTIDYILDPLNHLRTMWRWDQELQDWVDTSEAPTPDAEEPEEPLEG